MNLEQIKSIIPHRDPFLFVDEIIEMETMKYGKGLKTFHEDTPFFKGHFPNYPVVPGVILIEAMAQVGAIVALSSDEFKGKLAFFTGASKVKFRKKVLPGDTITIYCEISKIRGTFGFGKGFVYVDDEIACEAEISFALQ